jgi:hypothetical protein
MCLLSSSAQQTLRHIKYCEVNEWPQSKSCGAAFRWVLDGGYGPFMSVKSRPFDRIAAMRLTAATSPNCRMLRHA